jgi:very-long-chain (3R)-3-hydroxyacyl-CoA dehydratase
MDTKEASGTVRKPGPKPLQSSSLRTQYLGRVVLLVPMVGFGNVYQGTENFTKWTQTMALLEVVHSAVGMLPYINVLF